VRYNEESDDQYVPGSDAGASTGPRKGLFIGLREALKIAKAADFFVEGAELAYRDVEDCIVYRLVNQENLTAMVSRHQCS
jgi:hypothetical protein